MKIKTCDCPRWQAVIAPVIHRTPCSFLYCPWCGKRLGEVCVPKYLKPKSTTGVSLDEINAELGGLLHRIKERRDETEYTKEDKEWFDREFGGGHGTE